MLSGEEETDITNYFIETAFPTPKEVRQVISALEKAPAGLSVPELLSSANLSKGRIQKTLALLSLESPAPVVKQGPKWQLAAAVLSYGFWERADRLTELRRKEQRQMQEYVGLDSGHMEFLIRALDGDPEAAAPPRMPPLSTRASREVEQDAIAFLRRLDLTIGPRLRWPVGGLSRYEVKGMIAQPHRAQEGRALCYWSDGGWGTMVRRGKYEDGGFADELVEACVDLLARWNPQPEPRWVTCIPSLRHPNLVPNLARRLADQLELPFLATLWELELRDEQKSMANSTQQARNRDGSFAVRSPPLPPQPVLLVDDIVGSRWTFTVAAWLLRRHGTGEVWPLALSSLGRGQ